MFRKKICCFSILWMIICSNIFLEGDFSCLSRIDGKELTQKEAEEIWESIIYQDEQSREISVTYKLKILEWIEENYHINKS